MKTEDLPQLPPGYSYRPKTTSKTSPWPDIKADNDVLVAWAANFQEQPVYYISTDNKDEPGHEIEAPTPEDALSIIVAKLWLGDFEGSEPDE